MPTNLIDIGANLAHDSFDDDRADVVQRASAVGVSRIVVTGSSHASNLRAATIAGEYPGALFATAGVHPHHASEYDDVSDTRIRELVKQDAVVAVGECGLDYFRNFSPRDAQISAFERQLDVAADTGLPLFLHQRDAHQDFRAIIKSAHGRFSRAVAHCFTGDETALRNYVDLDLYIGITGWICDERRGRSLYDIVKLIPDNRLMIETDAPYLLPRTLRPKPKSRRSEPCHLPEVLRVVAEARDQSSELVAQLTTENAVRFFDLPD